MAANKKSGSFLLKKYKKTLIKNKKRKCENLIKILIEDLFAAKTTQKVEIIVIWFKLSLPFDKTAKLLVEYFAKYCIFLNNMRKYLR